MLHYEPVRKRGHEVTPSRSYIAIGVQAQCFKKLGLIGFKRVNLICFVAVRYHLLNKLGAFDQNVSRATQTSKDDNGGSEDLCRHNSLPPAFPVKFECFGSQNPFLGTCSHNISMEIV